MNIGFRVFLRVPRPDPEIVARLMSSSVPSLADAMHGRGVMNNEIGQIYTPMRRISGVAITVDLTPGDGLMLRKALEVAQIGDVIVANAHACMDRAVLGSNVCASALRRRLAGIVVDGVVRDVREIADMDLPVMARGSSPRSGTTTEGWGEVNVPIACGGVVVCPGDIVVGDRDGIIVIPGDYAAEVLRKAEAMKNEKGGPEGLPVSMADAHAVQVHGAAKANKAINERHGTIVDGPFDWWEARL